MSGAGDAPVLPLHLSIAGRVVVVVGGGAVGARKVASCLEAGATVRVISPWVCADLAAHARAGHITWRARSFRPGDLSGAWLAFAATDERTVNEAVQAEAELRRIFCVRADAAAQGSARCPAVLRRDDVVIGVSSSSSGAADPSRIRDLRDALASAMAAGTLAVPRQRDEPPTPDRQRDRASVADGPRAQATAQDRRSYPA